MKLWPILFCSLFFKPALGARYEATLTALLRHLELATTSQTPAVFLVGETHDHAQWRTRGLPVVAAKAQTLDFRLFYEGFLYSPISPTPKTYTVPETKVPWEGVEDAPLYRLHIQALTLSLLIEKRALMEDLYWAKSHGLWATHAYYWGLLVQGQDPRLWPAGTWHPPSWSEVTPNPHNHPYFAKAQGAAVLKTADMANWLNNQHIAWLKSLIFYNTRGLLLAHPPLAAFVSKVTPTVHTALQSGVYPTPIFKEWAFKHDLNSLSHKVEQLRNTQFCNTLATGLAVAPQVPGVLMVMGQKHLEGVAMCLRSIGGYVGNAPIYTFDMSSQVLFSPKGWVHPPINPHRGARPRPRPLHH